MAKPITFTAIDSKAGTVINDPARLAASRCMTILFQASKAVTAIETNMVRPDEGRITQALAELVFTMVDQSNGSGAQLEADIRTMAKMLGCELMAVDPSQIGRA